MQELAKHFIPAADEAYLLLSGRGFESDLFRTIWVHGHFRGSPDLNSQGVYAITPSGILLASTYAIHAEPVIEVLERALESWKQLRPEQRLRGKLPPTRELERQRLAKLYPEGGLVLKAFYRDLPRKPEECPPGSYREAFHRTAWNQDFAWFRKAEARALLPERLAKGEEHVVPEALTTRLVCLHLVDHVRSVSLPFQSHELVAARLTARVVQNDGDLVVVRFDGESHTSTEGRWPVDSSEAAEGRASPQSRGYRGKLLGWGTWSQARERFVAFDLVAAGTRWGGTAYSARAGDLHPTPLGVAFTLAGETPADRVAPFFAIAYQAIWK